MVHKAKVAILEDLVAGLRVLMQPVLGVKRAPAADDVTAKQQRGGRAKEVNPLQQVASADLAA